MKVSDLIQSQQISRVRPDQEIRRPDASGTDEKAQVNFGDTMKDFLNAVNEDKAEAAQKVEDIIQGRSENLAEAMSALEESGLSFQLMLEIRNKLVQSFQEINRIPV